MQGQLEQMRTAQEKEGASENRLQIPLGQFLAGKNSTVYFLGFDALSDQRGRSCEIFETNHSAIKGNGAFFVNSQQSLFCIDLQVATVQLLVQ